MNTQKGLVPVAIILAVVGILLVGSGAYYLAKNYKPKPTENPVTSENIQKTTQPEQLISPKVSEQAPKGVENAIENSQKQNKIIIKQSGGGAALVMECGDKNYVTKTADYIIEGTVEKVESRYNKEKTLIFTYSDLLIEKYIKGKPFTENKIQIITPGGTVGEIAQLVEDQPIFHEGKKVIVYFLERNGEFEIICGSQGVEVKDETANWKTYRNEKYGFEVKYPAEGIVKEIDSDFFEKLISIELPRGEKFFSFISRVIDLNFFCCQIAPSERFCGSKEMLEAKLPLQYKINFDYQICEREKNLELKNLVQDIVSHKMMPFGKNPVINFLKIDGQEAAIIESDSLTALPENKEAIEIIVKLPKFVVTKHNKGDGYGSSEIFEAQFLEISSRKSYKNQILSTFKFISQ